MANNEVKNTQTMLQDNEKEQENEQTHLETVEKDKFQKTDGEETDEALVKEEEDSERRERRRKHRRRKKGEEEERKEDKRTHHHRRKKKHRSQSQTNDTEEEKKPMNDFENPHFLEQQQQPQLPHTQIDMQQQPQQPPPQYNEINQYNTQYPLQLPEQMQLYPQQQGDAYSKNTLHDPNVPNSVTITQQPQQYGGPPFQQQVVLRGPPPNYMALSWIVCLFCCWPIGIAAIMASSQVKNLYAAGNYEGAERSSNRAKALAITGLILGPILVAVIYVIRLMGTKGY